MATTTNKVYKVLWQYAPAVVNTWELAFTVDAMTIRGLVSTALAVNQDAADQTFRLAVVKGGGGPPTLAKQNIAFDEPIYAKHRYPMTEGWALSPGDEIWFQASSLNVTTSGFGYAEMGSST